MREIKNKSVPESAPYMEQQRFEAALGKIVGKKHNDKGIGTL